MNTPRKKTDLRIQKTLHALTSALYALLCEKSLDAVTVTELCEKAQTRKATFYNHFSDKYELLAFMVRELIEDSEEDGRVSFDPQTPERYYVDIFRHFLDFFEENEKMAQQILQSSASSAVLDLLQEQMQPYLTGQMRRAGKSGNALILSPELLSEFFSGAVVQGARWWFLHRASVEKELAVTQFSMVIHLLFEQKISEQQ